ncbi:sulfatase [Martelella sp. HB161492]|uniref:sulfatase family protein n=1 Tax=Martelella sp. HB161492 TaxID=2720726 RepID=UPI001591BCA1|nr:sulfatase [Martelella sp. HB161492]
MSAPLKITRRSMLMASAATVGIAALPRLTLAETQSTAPNIVWVVCHDIHAPLLGTYGNGLATTPTIDRLAAEGTRFDHAYSVAPVCSPSRFALVTGMYPDSCGPANQMRGIGHVPEEFKPLPILMREAGYYATNNVFTDYNCDLDPDRIWDECSITAHWRNRPQGKPFFCVYNYLITHESRAIHFSGDLKTDPASVTVPPYLPDIPEIRTAFAQNVDLVDRQDVALKTLLDQLDEDGLADNTVVIFMADHGGVVPRSKRYCYNEGLHIPLIVRVPEALAHLRGSFQPGQPTGQVVSNVDMAPTTLAIAGVSIPENMHGKPFLGAAPQSREIAFSMRNRMDERYDMVRTATDGQFRYIRNYSPHRAYGLHNAYEWQLHGYQAWEREHLAGTLTDAQDRFWQQKPAEELYDLAADPYQLENLAADPAYGEQLARLSTALDQHMVAVNDNGLIPEGIAAEGYWPSRAEGAYPIEDVMALAARGLQKQTENAGDFVAALKSGNEIMRFWAAQSLLMLGVIPDAVRPDVVACMQNDESGHVRCVLAEVIGHTPDGAAAGKVLSDILFSDAEPRVKLLALESLTYMPVEYAMIARDAVEQAPRVGDEYVTEAYNYLSLKLDDLYRPDVPTYFGGQPKLGKPLGDPRI